jgi:hypothetical protein
MAERKAVTKQMVARYARASKSEKGRMLDELTTLTGWTRRHARRSLTAMALPQRPRKPGLGPTVPRSSRGSLVGFGDDSE